MPKVKKNRVEYLEGCRAYPSRDLQAKMKEAEDDAHDVKGKCEASWPIFRLAHRRSHCVFDLYHRRQEISMEFCEFCLEKGYADCNIIARWKKAMTVFTMGSFLLVCILLLCRFK